MQKLLKTVIQLKKLNSFIKIRKKQFRYILLQTEYASIDDLLVKPFTNTENILVQIRREQYLKTLQLHFIIFIAYHSNPLNVKWNT